MFNVPIIFKGIKGLQNFVVVMQVIKLSALYVLCKLYTSAVFPACENASYVTKVKCFNFPNILQKHKSILTGKQDL
jgi:hypothetical protein